MDVEVTCTIQETVDVDVSKIKTAFSRQVSIYLRQNASAFQNTLVTRSKQNPNDVIEVRESRLVTSSIGVVRIVQMDLR